MKKRFTTIMALVIALAMSMTLVAGAFEATDTNCSITVTAKVGERLIEGIELAVYKVGEARIEDNNLYYDVADVIANANPDKVIDLNGMKDDANKDNSEEIALRIRNILNGKKDAPAYNDLMEIKSENVTTDENGVAVFDGLTPGVYLVRQEAINWTFETITPILIAAPYTNTEGTEWVFDIEVFAKLQYRPDDEDETTKGTTGTTEPTIDIPDPNVPTGGTSEGEFDIDDPEIPKEELPETGMHQWPVPFMAMTGMVLFGMGYASEKKNKN